ncbi:hypothetical protein QFC20_001370 [Naganishia adeliensis]|uniref:Uncharacterized protein n=1 Tax=Naganishia adeliensis TaxID=92952 RepID=A0ACC2WVE3_9TREE|nr:hypothetical protein QFC20_001370 [Naganishia adeliensis]
MRFGILVCISLAARAYAQAINDTYIKDLIDGLKYASQPSQVSTSPTCDDTIYSSANFTALTGAIQSLSSTAAGTGTALLAGLPGFQDHGNGCSLRQTSLARGRIPRSHVNGKHLIVRYAARPFLLPTSPQVSRVDRSQAIVFNRVNDTDGKERIAIPYQNGGTAYAVVEAIEVGNLKVFVVDRILVSYM